MASRMQVMNLWQHVKFQLEDRVLERLLVPAVRDWDRELNAKSPVGKALLTAQVGDELTIPPPHDTFVFEGLILLVVFLLLWGGHWMRWRVLPFLVDERGDLHRSLAYVYGCACILAGFALWVSQGQTMPFVRGWDAVWFLARAMIAAGMGTVIPRGIKWIQESQAVREDRVEYEQAIENRRQET